MLGAPAAIALIIAMSWGSAGAQTSAPGSQSGADRGVSFAVGFEDLGLGPSLALAGITATQTITLPVPAGLSPATIDGRASVSLDTPEATVEFSSGSDSLLRLRVAGGAATPFSVPLGSIPVHNGSVAVTVTSLVAFPDAFCRGQFRVPLVTMDQLRFGYAGSATMPTTVAEFFSPVLGLLRLWVPPGPSVAQFQAASDLTSALATLNPNRRMHVEVHPLPAEGLPDPGPFVANVRDVLVGVAGQPSASVVFATSGAPLLVLGGDGPGLELAESVVVSKLAGLVQSSQSTIAGTFAPTVIPATEQTVKELGAGILEVSGEGRLHLDVPFSQAQFGGMINAVTLHLKGSYTPVPAGSSAALSVLVNRQVVATPTLDGSGRFDLQQRVPAAAIGRDNVVTLEVAYTPAQGVCAAGSVPFDLRLDPSSTVQTHWGASLAVGFRRLPQALLPGFDLAVDQLDVPRASAALRLIASICQLSGVPLQARVVPLGSIGASTRPALVFATAGALPPGLHPTVDLRADAGSMEIDQPGRHVDIGTLDAAAEVFTANDRTVTLVTWRSLDALGRLVEALTSPESGLADLTTDVAVLSAEGTLTQVPVAETLTGRPAPGGNGPGWPWWAVPTLAAVVLGAGVVVVQRVRRRRS